MWDTSLQQPSLKKYQTTIIKEWRWNQETWDLANEVFLSRVCGAETTIETDDAFWIVLLRVGGWGREACECWCSWSVVVDVDEWKETEEPLEVDNTCLLFCARDNASLENLFWSMVDPFFLTLSLNPFSYLARIPRCWLLLIFFLDLLWHAEPGGFSFMCTKRMLIDSLWNCLMTSQVFVWRFGRFRKRTSSSSGTYDRVPSQVLRAAYPPARSRGYVG